MEDGPRALTAVSRWVGGNISRLGEMGVGSREGRCKGCGEPIFEFCNWERYIDSWCLVVVSV